MDRINIQNPELLAITRITGWSIYFTYDNEYYFLKKSDAEYENRITLYKRKLNKHGTTTEVEYLNGCLTNRHIWSFFKESNPNKKSLKHLDKAYFILQLFYLDFAEGVYDEYTKYSELINTKLYGLFDLRRDLDKKLKKFYSYREITDIKKLIKTEKELSDIYKILENIIQEEN